MREERIARQLLRIRAVFFRPEEPFTWASGIKSPVYTDNRLILTDVEARNEVEAALAEVVKTEYPEANIAAIDYDPGASEVNQLNRIKLMLSAARMKLDGADE